MGAIFTFVLTLISLRLAGAAGIQQPVASGCPTQQQIVAAINQHVGNEPVIAWRYEDLVCSRQWATLLRRPPESMENSMEDMRVVLRFRNNRWAMTWGGTEGCANEVPAQLRTALHCTE